MNYLRTNNSGVLVRGAGWFTQIIEGIVGQKMTVRKM
jgi:hypothetical protein